VGCTVITSERSFRAWIVETRRCCGMKVLRAQVRFSAAAMTKSSGVTDGFVRCTQDSSSRQPEFSTPIVFGGCAKDKRLFAVFRIGAMLVWFVMYKCLHPDWNKLIFVVVMMVIDMCIADKLGCSHDCWRRSSCRSTCGRSWHQRCNGKVGA
jgi:hypothetical protein